MSLDFLCDVIERRGLWAAALSCLLAGCATPAPVEQVDYTQQVGRWVLPPTGAQTGTSEVQRYTPQPSERFRMPVIVDEPAPVLPQEMAMRELPATLVCARVAIAADGTVMFADALSTRAECVAGAEPANRPLVDAMLTALRGWRFEPAALCHFSADARVPDGESCEGAERIEPVPVTLEFAFTFAVREGRIQVSHGRAPR